MGESENENIIDWTAVNFGIPKAFFDSLFDGSDWAFVIKIHALIEAALNHILVNHFRNEELSSIIAKLETSDPQKGKIAFIGACELLPDITRNFVIQISKLRNKLVHDLRNFGLTIPEYVSALDKKQLPIWRNSISAQFFIKQGPPDIQTALDFVDHSPKQAIFTSVLYLLQAAQATRAEWKECESSSDQSTPKE